MTGEWVVSLACMTFPGVLGVPLKVLDAGVNGVFLECTKLQGSEWGCSWYA